MARVRKLGRRSVESGSFLSDEPALRTMQIRFIANFLGISSLFFFLAYRKFIYLFGLVPVMSGTAVLAGGVIALIIKGRRKGPIEEPKDVELDIVDTELEEQVRRGDVQPMDLVFERGVWTTVHQSMRFAEAAEGPMQKLTRQKQLVMVGYVTMGLLVLAGLGVFLLNFGRFFDWLNDVP